eukprot:TRINITY_DN1346_c0_g1_i1.p1 TRINITY_DN1346_c0_g1~~TRINITY_DN1346_c0_g1_i1.p1  ORF type:complete len:599 (+),score=61.45 TRINITY_DN1346_c0_g1_i1:97-1893(+)
MSHPSYTKPGSVKMDEASGTNFGVMTPTADIFFGRATGTTAPPSAIRPPNRSPHESSLTTPPSRSHRSSHESGLRTPPSTRSPHRSPLESSLSASRSPHESSLTTPPPKSHRSPHESGLRTPPSSRSHRSPHESTLAPPPAKPGSLARSGPRSGLPVSHSASRPHSSATSTAPITESGRSSYPSATDKGGYSSHLPAHSVSTSPGGRVLPSGMSASVSPTGTPSKSKHSTRVSHSHRSSAHPSDGSFRKSSKMPSFTSSRNFPKSIPSQPKGKRLIDIVFCMDCTSSMGDFIDEAKRSIKKIVTKVNDTDNSHVRFGYVAYRDHADSFITSCHDFVEDPDDMSKIISLYDAHGGGDGPEAVTPAMDEALHFRFRDNAAKVVILIADAPPHGVVPQTGKIHEMDVDDYPEGDPSGHDPVDIARKMAARGITFHVVAVEPFLSKYRGAHDLMQGLAEITDGRFLPLTSADLLPDIITSAAQEELSLFDAEQVVTQSYRKMKEAKMSNEKITANLESILSSKNIKSKQMSVPNIYGNYDRTNVDSVLKSRNLKSAIASQKNIAQPKMDLSTKKVAFVKESSIPVSKIMSRCERRSVKSGHM